MSGISTARRTGVLAAAVLGLGVLFAPVASAQSAGLHAPDKAGRTGSGTPGPSAGPQDVEQVDAAVAVLDQVVDDAAAVGPEGP